MTRTKRMMKRHTDGKATTPVVEARRPDRYSGDFSVQGMTASQETALLLLSQLGKVSYASVVKAGPVMMAAFRDLTRRGLATLKGATFELADVTGHVLPHRGHHGRKAA